MPMLGTHNVYDVHYQQKLATSHTRDRHKLYPYPKKMKRILIILGICFLILSCSQKINDKSNVKALLVHQLKNTHTNQEWFVPTKTAIEGLTPEQSNWKDSTENHSIGELVSHLIFWNEINLKAFKGEKVSEFNEDNKETFMKNSAVDWEFAYRRLDSIQTEWERLTENATDEQIKEWSPEIANMASHTAYHTGQIIYIRKKNGWWTKK
tara:strand:+ start:232 stop:858 length:627 start_codon:yes stop_codon:yes gene_type:complete